MTTDKLLYDIKIFEQQNNKLLSGILLQLQTLNKTLQSFQSQFKIMSNQTISESKLRVKTIKKQQLINESNSNNSQDTII